MYCKRGTITGMTYTVRMMHAALRAGLSEPEKECSLWVSSWKKHIMFVKVQEAE